MKKSSIFLIAFVLLLSACSQTSDWKKVVIPKNDKIVFINQDDAYLKVIAVPIEDNDTLFISSSRLIERTCYLKLAFPDSSIIIEYVTSSDKKGKKAAARFINIKESF